MQPEYVVTIEIDDAYAAEVDTDALEALVSYVLQGEQVAGPAEVSLWITNAEEIRVLNRTYRDVDATTDVLSFGADDGADMQFVSAPGQPRYLGDVAISYPHVARQAEEYGHSRRRELAYLLTHGLLHLLGYDHEQPHDAAQMRSREESLLHALGITREGAHGA